MTTSNARILLVALLATLAGLALVSPASGQDAAPATASAPATTEEAPSPARAQKSALVDIATIELALDMCQHDCGRYPTTEEGLAALVKQPAEIRGWKGPYIKRLPKDPWGNDYVYSCPGKHNANGIDLYSPGPDGKYFTSDDINNWAQDKESPGQGSASQSSATGPATQTATTSAPATDPAAVKILRDMEASQSKIATIQADINYKVVSAVLGDEEVRTGYFMGQRETAKVPTKVRIHFDTLKQGDGPKIVNVVDYVFDGMWLLVAEHANKKLRRIQLAAPGQKVEPLKIGKGPFPIPFWQPADDVLACCSVTTRAVGAGEPKGTQYLKLIPLPKHKEEMNFAELQVWVDPALGMPVKIIARESNDTVTTVTFGQDKSGKTVIATNKVFKPENFALERPAGWSLEVTTLDQARGGK